MTPTDDDVIARLRASLKATADRTPITAGRSIAVTALAEQSPTRSLVPAFSAAAAVATMVAVAAVVASAQSGGHRSVQSGAGAPGVASSGSAIATPPSKPMPVASAVDGSAAPQHSPGGCVPENYYVTASPAEVAGLSYMLPATPAGYVLYGAWGTISRNLCADSVTWYVEYDPVGGATGSGTDAIQLRVTEVGGGQTAGYAKGTPPGALHVTVGGHDGRLLAEGTYGIVEWASGGDDIQLNAPIVDGNIASLVHVADSVVLLNPTDPRIVAPADCQVPPGSVCGGDSATPTPTVSPNSTLTADPLVGPLPTPTPTAG